MADSKKGILSIDVDPIALNGVIQTLRALDKETSKEVRDLSQPLSRRLAQALTVSAAFSAAPPQAILVARSITTPRDRMIRVDVGGPKKVGRPYGGTADARGKVRNRIAAPAGALLWGSEYGSAAKAEDRAGRRMGLRFVKTYNKQGYWIRPAVDANVQEVADEYTAMLKGIVKRLKLEGGA